MKVVKKLSHINAAIADVRASIPPDPYAGLTDRDRALVAAYTSKTPAVEQYQDVINGTGVLSALFPGLLLPASMSVQQLAEIYQKEVEAYAHRRKFKGIPSCSTTCANSKLR